MNRHLLGWGVFFIVLGAVPLAVRGGYLDEDVVLRAWSLWPLILIGIGISLMLRRTGAAVIGNLVIGVTAGLMFGSLLAAGIEGIGTPGVTACGLGIGGASERFDDQQGSLGGAARVSVELDCGDLHVSTAQGNAWSLTGTSHNGEAPAISQAADRLAISPSRTNGSSGFGSSRGVAWTLTLPQAPRTQLDLSVNAGSADVGLDTMMLERLQASVNAGSATLDLSNALAVDRLDGSVNAGSLVVSLPAVSVTGGLSANAGSVELCVPAGVDLRLRVTDNTLGSTNFGDRGLTRDGDTWQTPGYGSADAQVDLTFSVNLGSITLDPEDGCE